MAKRGTTATEHKIEDFAEDLGRLLGNAQAKAQGWMGQRQAIAKHLSEIRDTAATLLADLGQQTQRGLRRGKRAYIVAAAVAPVSPQKRRKLSAKARKAISDAQKKRWAAVRAAKKAGGKK